MDVETMIYLGWAVIFFLLFLAFLINQTVVASIEKMSKPEGLFKRVEQVNDEGFLVQFKTFDEWATKNAFVHDCLFLSHTVLDNSAIQCSAWWSQRDAAWALMYYYKGKCFYDFVMKLGDENSISTASAKDALILPATSGSYRQAFTGLSLDALYQKHQAAATLLNSKLAIAVQKNKGDVIQEIIAALVRQTGYIKTIKYWRYKGVFWYVYRRNFLGNKPIKL